MSGYSAAPIAASDAVLLRPEEAAVLLRLSRTKVYALMRDGELRSKKIDRRRRIPRSAVDEYANSRPSIFSADPTADNSPG